MQKIWLLMENQSSFVYVIAGICFFGVLAKLLSRLKMYRLLKASENMALTKNHQMKTIRNHYENNLNMDIQVANISAFVEKYILKIKYGGIPIRIWDSFTIEAIFLAVAISGVGIINAMYKGYDDSVVAQILVVTIVAGGILVTFENLLRFDDISNQIEVNIEDYLDNNLRSRIGRPIISRQERGMNSSINSQDSLAAVASEIVERMAKDSVERMAKNSPEHMEDALVEHMAKEGAIVKDTAGREKSRPEPEEIPEYEIRRKATRSYSLRNQEYGSVDGNGVNSRAFDKKHNEKIEEVECDESEASAATLIDDRGSTNRGSADRRSSDREAEIVAEVLRNFFSG